jgi:hypothetical protein
MDWRFLILGLCTVQGIGNHVLLTSPYELLFYPKLLECFKKCLCCKLGDRFLNWPNEFFFWKLNCTDGKRHYQLAYILNFGWKKTLPISLHSKFQSIPMYHDKDYSTSWCKNLKLVMKAKLQLIKPSFIGNSVLGVKKLIGKFIQTKIRF